SRALPIENSPPGIHTMPGGAAAGAETVFGAVGAKLNDVADVFNSSEFAGEVVVETGLRNHEALMVWTVKAAAVTNPNASNQPSRVLFFEFFFCFIPSSQAQRSNIIKLSFESENAPPVALRADNGPSICGSPLNFRMRHTVGGRSTCVCLRVCRRC